MTSCIGFACRKTSRAHTIVAFSLPDDMATGVIPHIQHVHFTKQSRRIGGVIVSRAHLECRRS